MIGLNTAFKQIFSERLNEHGFIKIKGRQPYFVRLVAGEIIQVIACRSEWSSRPKEYKRFDILAGMATVYKPELDFSCTPRHNQNWIEPIYRFYYEILPSDTNDEVANALYTFEYQIENEDSLRKELKRAVDATENYVLPKFDRVKDLESFMDFIMLHSSPDLSIPQYDPERDAFVPTNDPENEGLLYIRINSRDDLKNKFSERLSKSVKLIERGEWYRTYEEEKEGWENYRLKTVERRDRIYNDPFVYRRALEELERRKSANLRVLEECGVIGEVKSV